MERSGVYAAATGHCGAKKKYWCTTHKFGIGVPRTVEDALDINRKTGTNFWGEDIRKETTNVRIAFEDLNSVTPE